MAGMAVWALALSSFRFVAVVRRARSLACSRRRSRLVRRLARPPRPPEEGCRGPPQASECEVLAVLQVLADPGCVPGHQLASQQRWEVFVPVHLGQL